MIKKRNTGRTHDMVLSIKTALQQGDNIAVIGCTNPKPILDRLGELGVIAKAKAMLTTKSLEPVYGIVGNEEHIVNWKTAKEQLTGYIFYIK